MFNFEHHTFYDLKEKMYVSHNIYSESLYISPIDSIQFKLDKNKIAIEAHEYLSTVHDNVS